VDRESESLSRQTPGLTDLVEGDLRGGAVDRRGETLVWFEGPLVGHAECAPVHGDEETGLHLVEDIPCLFGTGMAVNVRIVSANGKQGHIRPPPFQGRRQLLGVGGIAGK
jgi:hypothetical protein